MNRINWKNAIIADTDKSTMTPVITMLRKYVFVVTWISLIQYKDESPQTK